MTSSEAGYSSFSNWVQSSMWQSHGEANNNNYSARGNNNNDTLDLTPSTNILTDINTLLWRVVPPGILLLGSFGNVMTVMVMRRMRASQSTACLSLYFTALALSDQVQLVTAVLFFWVGRGFSWPPPFFKFNLLCSLPTIVYHVTGITSAWFLVTMTYQRVTSVVAPHRVAVLCTVKRGKIIVAFIFLFAITMNFHFLFTFVYWPEYRNCQFHRNYIFLIDYLEWQFMVFYSIAPFFFLAIGNCILIQQVIKSAELSRKMRAGADPKKTAGADRFHSMSVTLIVTSAAYLIFTLPPCIFSIYMQMDHIKISDEETRAVVELVKTFLTFGWISATASNFYLYLLSGRKFRQEAKRYLWCHNTDDGQKTTSKYSSR